MNYRTEGTPNNEKIDNGHRYLYDANGNLVYINTSRVKKDGKEDEQATEKKYRWDEENRLLASDENGFVANYWYDADGERTVKSSGEGEQIYVNSEFSGGLTNTAKFSLYVSPYLVASQSGKYTKHIYIGSQRIVSKLGDLASYGADPRRIPYAGTEADGISVDYQSKYNRQQQVIKDNYADFGVPYNGEDNNDYVNGQGFCCNDVVEASAPAKAMARIDGNFKPNDDYEKLQFYYHPDHLGSSSYITNLDGEVVQHIEYVPFGEVFIEERNNTWNTPYLFNAKEYDEETGMYYYGARYYEPRISLWMSTDPMEEDYYSYSSYTYVFNNPIRFIDPTGLSGDEPDGVSMTRNFVKGLGQSLWGTVEGVWNIVRHPINTAQNIATAVSHPKRTYNAIKSSVKQTYDDFSKGNRDVKANIAGKVTGEVAQLLIGSGAIKGVTKGARAAKTASATEKTVEATTTVTKAGGRLGTASTRKQIVEISSELESRGYTIVGGGGKMPEEYLAPLSGKGTKGGSYLDITADHPQYGRLRINTVDGKMA